MTSMEKVMDPLAHPVMGLKKHAEYNKYYLNLSFNKNGIEATHCDFSFQTYFRLCKFIVMMRKF